MGVMTSITYLASILLIVGVVYEHGFTISEVEAHQLQRLYHGVWIVFLVDVTLRILLEYKDTRRTFSKLTWILTILLYLTLIPVIFHRPEEEGAILQFWEFLHGKAVKIVRNIKQATACPSVWQFAFTEEFLLEDCKCLLL